jgi:tetratricopeptide (TPR) repeat protein
MGDRTTAQAFYNQAVEAHNVRDTDSRMRTHSYQMFASACMADPTWHLPLYQVGNNNFDLKLFHSAISCWRRSLECTQTPTERAKTLSNLGMALHAIGETVEAEAASLVALELDPTLSHACMNLSNIYVVLDNPGKAVEYARQAHALEPSSMAEFNLAFALLFDRQLKEGFRYFEARFPYRLKEYMQYPYPKWDGEPDKIVFLAADQGMGDTLSYARFVPQLCATAKYVIARIQAPLVRLFVHAFRDIRNLEVIPTAYPFPAADVWTTFVSLPHNLGLDDTAIYNAPSLDVGSWSVPDNWRVPDRKLHVGIAWAGSPLNDIDAHRNLPIHNFFELFRADGVQLYSLQVGDRANEIHGIGGGAIVRDVVPYITDVCDALAILKRLDMVISVESFLPHLCSFIGKECWVPYSYLGRDYRIGCTGSDLERLWTPKHRIFRQPPSLDWRPVFADMARALEAKIFALDMAKQKGVAAQPSWVK